MTINQIEIGGRIKAVRGDLSGKEFANKIGVTFTVVSAYEKGKAWPKPQTLDKIIQLSGKPADWLLYGKDGDCLVEEPMGEYSNSNMVTMPVYALAGAGPPCCIDTLEPIGEILVERKYDGPNIRVVRIKGDSMQPTLFDGCHCGVDISDKQIVSGELYAVYIPHEGIVVKRIILGHEVVKIVSDNPLIPNDDVSADCINWDSFIQGKVKWWVVLKEG